MDWFGAKILDRESHRKTRQLSESIHICREVNCMNRDGEPTAYLRPMIVFWSHVQQQHHVTTCLMKFAIGEQNVTI